MSSTWYYHDKMGVTIWRHRLYLAIIQQIFQFTMRRIHIKNHWKSATVEINWTNIYTSSWHYMYSNWEAVYIHLCVYLPFYLHLSMIRFAVSRLAIRSLFHGLCSVWHSLLLRWERDSKQRAQTVRVFEMAMETGEKREEERVANA